MIDQARLRELMDDFGAEDFDDLIQSFLEEASEVVTRLETLISQEPSEERSAQFHFLKGCALNIGAADLARLCQELEDRNAAFSGADFQNLLAQFRSVQAFFANGGLRRIA